MEGDPHLKLNLYKVISIPHPVNEHLTLNYNDLPKYLAISEDQTLYMEMDNMNTCRNHNNNYICPIETPIYKETSESCALSIFKNKSNDISCSKHFGPKLQKPIVLKTEGTWIYATNQAFELVINCPSYTN